ncbi:mitochondrial carrier [Hesseltinella vesiculosa]|uniref:Mitochondrial carrier n=1 Tax=Hesseltinella vesiculosa TaxID=101127 RepID=A0A1X2G396_9FUNG|nr:mitochondrial carrier [Hesseltinella vesiculosa]
MTLMPFVGQLGLGNPIIKHSSSLKEGRSKFLHQYELSCQQSESIALQSISRHLLLHNQIIPSADHPITESKETITGIAIAIGTMMTNYVICFPIVVSRHGLQALSQPITSWQRDTPAYCFHLLRIKWETYGLRSLYAGFGLGLIGQVVTSSYETCLKHMFASIWGTPALAQPIHIRWLYQGLKCLIHVPLYPLFRTALILRVQPFDRTLITSLTDFIAHYKQDLRRFWRPATTAGALSIWSTFVPFFLFNAFAEKCMMWIYKQAYHFWLQKGETTVKSSKCTDNTIMCSLSTTTAAIPQSFDQPVTQPLAPSPKPKRPISSSLRCVYFPEIACGMLSSLLTRTMTYPLDTVNFKLMVQDTGFTTEIYTGIWDCCRHMYLEGGWRAFFPGWGAGILELAATYVVLEASWCLYSWIDHCTQQRRRTALNIIFK